MSMTTGELTVLVTTIVGFSVTLVSQWAAISQANRTAKDAIDNREQDRLDREQKADELLQLQRFELEKIQITTQATAAELTRRTTAVAIDVKRQVENTAAEVRQYTVASAAEVKRLLDMAEQTASNQRAETAEAIANNTELTRLGVRRADAAFHEANTVNAKLEKLAIDTMAEQKHKDVQQQRIEDAVDDTRAKVIEVHDIIISDDGAQ